MSEIKIAIVSDEISQDFITATGLGLEWGINNFEIRSVNLHRVPNISPQEREIILQTLKEYNINIPAISPGLFKIELESDELDTHLNKHLQQSFELAHQVGAEKIIVFGFIKPKGKPSSHYPQQVVDVLGEAAQKAQGDGIMLALENESICWADTGEVTADIVSKVAVKNLGINWDPGNALVSGEKHPYPEGYEKVREHIIHLHIKDSKRTHDNRYRFVDLGEGEINWKGQIEALIKDGFKGYYTVETHFRPLVKTSKVCIENLRKIISEIEKGEKHPPM